MKESQLKTMFIFGLVLMLSLFLAYAVSTTLTSPADNSVDDDGYLDLKGTCTGTANSNVSAATLYSNVDGTWKANKTITSLLGLGDGMVYYANFTNYINKSAEGTYKWNIECTDNSSATSFAGNNTIIVQYAKPTVTTTSPADGTYSLNGHEIAVVCTASPYSGWNLTSVSLMTNIKGTTNWLINQTHTPALPQEGEVVANFTINKFGNSSIADGTDLLYGCYAIQQINLSNTGNEAVVTSNTASANRTLNVEFPPVTTLNGPEDGVWSQTKLINLSWTTFTKWDSGTQINTRVYTNESGEWLPVTGTIHATNNTQKDYSYDFNEKSYIRWTIQAMQQNNGAVYNISVNRTIKIDATNPTISVATGALTTSDTTPAIYATITDANLAALKVFTNFSGTWAVNSTNLSLTSGTEANYFNNTALADGVYIWSLVANDSSGRLTSSANESLIIDTTMPTISAVTNVSIPSKCDQMNITFTVSEVANYTMQYDTDTDVSDGSSISSSVKTTSQGAALDFDYNGESTYYFNITVTDVAGNKNSSNGRTTYFTPARVCTGWSQYAIYDSLINLSAVQNQTGAELVYFWNATNQNWVYKTAGLTTNDGVKIGKTTAYHVAHLYENTNSTWFRNITDFGVYNYNVTSTNNFISVPTDYDFGNLSHSFMNASTLNGLEVLPSQINTSNVGGGAGAGIYGPFNITMFAGYNNSKQDYVSHIFNFTWSNTTLLEPCPSRANKVTCMETFWVASAFNVTWNTSSISGNWTI